MNDPAHSQFLPLAAGETSLAPTRMPAAPAAGLPAVDLAPDWRLRVAVRSDLGRARSHQEDAAGAFAPPDPSLAHSRGQLYVVADGMGGHRAGDVASQLALAEIQRTYYATSDDDPAAALRQAFAAASRTVYDHAQAAAAQHGMGTTAVAAALRGRQLSVASVGDSRAYLIHGGQISQLTTDHTWAAGLERSGVLTAEQAKHHPRRHMLTRALGSDPTVNPDVLHAELVPGDVLLLCTDGLTNYVADGEILAIAGQDAPSRAAQRLIDLANARGGADNITVVIVQAEPETAPAAKLLPGWRTSAQAWITRLAEEIRRRPLWQLIAAVVIAILLVALLIAILWPRSSPLQPVVLPSALRIWPAVGSALIA